MSHPDFPSLHVIDHPLVTHKLSLMRDEKTAQKSFNELCHELTLLLTYEATKGLETAEVEVKTPVMSCKVPMVVEPQPVILPILRAGIGMVAGLQSLLPAAKVGHIGLYRNEQTLKPEHYYFKIPKDSAQRRFFICDPMLATGGSAVAAIDALKEKGVSSIHFLCILAAPEGVQALSQAHPDVPIYTASLDKGLNEKAYIIPGLGDAGDRLFGTQ